MAAPNNGRVKKAKKSTPNGNANGYANGHANGHLNGHLNGHADKSKANGAVVRSSKKLQVRKSVAGSLTSIIAR
jgi:hypothetical protein